MAERTLTIRVQIDDRTVEQEDAIVAKVKAELAKLAGEPRPTFELSRASRETVATGNSGGS